MSTSRNLPPKGTAGLARLAVRGYSRWPLPPPRMIDTIFATRCPLKIYAVGFQRSRRVESPARTGRRTIVRATPCGTVRCGAWYYRRGRGDATFRDAHRHHRVPAQGPRVQRARHPLGGGARAGGQVRGLPLRRGRAHPLRPEGARHQPDLQPPACRPGTRCARAGASCSSAPPPRERPSRTTCPCSRPSWKTPMRAPCTCFPPRPSPRTSSRS